MTQDLGRTAVVIAAHENSADLVTCIRTFLSAVSRPGDLIFVDNGSMEPLHRVLAGRFPGISILLLPENRLFCGGYNAGIRLAIERGFEFVLIANADTEIVHSGFVSELLRAAQRRPNAAFIGPLVFWKSPRAVQKTCLEFPSVLRSLWQWVPWRLGPRRFERQPEREGEVSFLNGVCVFCRVRALQQIGLMDENMGGYVEDADWAWRARQRGWSSVFIPVPSVIHHESEQGYEPYSLKTFLLKRNTVYWFLKTGQPRSARLYAGASLLLAAGRKTLQPAQRIQQAYFFQRLRRSYLGLLRGEALGEWFGPPWGRWGEAGRV